MFENKTSWRFLNTGANNAFLNMAIDEAILDCHIQGYVPPTLRIYRWSPPALSIGYAQSIKDVDLDVCSKQGISVVRRLTGGRAVFHDDEVTYSVVASNYYGFSQSILESYKFISQGLIAAYQNLGIEISIEQGQKVKSNTNSACFLTSTQADLTYNGRKIAGSAQIRKGNSLLQHGSLIINHKIETIFSILKFSLPNFKNKAKNNFYNKTISLEEAAGKSKTYDEINEALLEGFRKALGVEFNFSVLTDRELCLSKQLKKEKYNKEHWNYRR